LLPSPYTIIPITLMYQAKMPVDSKNGRFLGTLLRVYRSDHSHAQHFCKFFINGWIRFRLVGYISVWLVSYLFSRAYTRISSLCLEKWCDIYLYRKYVPNKKLSRLYTVRSCIRTQFQFDAMCIENVDMKCFVRYLT
jgi:hypothetical protein